MAEASTQLKLLGVFHHGLPGREWHSRECNLHFRLNPLLSQNYQGPHSRGRDPPPFLFYTLRGSPELLPSFLPVPESLRVSRERNRHPGTRIICLPFTSHLPYFALKTQTHPFKYGSAHPQDIGRVIGHLSFYVGTHLFLFGRVNIELSIPGFEPTTLSFQLSTFLPFWTQPDYLELLQGIQVKVLLLADA